MHEGTRPPDFQIERIESDGLIIGRNCGDDIPVGTVFTTAAKVRIDGDLLHLSLVELGSVASIRLVLTAIQFYGRSVDLVPGGHTAGLGVGGEGLQQLLEAVRAVVPGEYIHLRG